jgi:hypothetical protein
MYLYTYLYIKQAFSTPSLLPPTVEEVANKGEIEGEKEGGKEGVIEVEEKVEEKVEKEGENSGLIIETASVEDSRSEYLAAKLKALVSDDSQRDGRYI